MTSCNRPLGVWAQVIRTAWFLLMTKQLIHHGTAKIRFFLLTLSPTLEERVEDDGNSGGGGDEEDIKVLL